MTLYIVGIAVLIALWLLLGWWGKQPAKHRLNVEQGDFRRYIEALLYRGYQRGFMIIEARDRKRFIQFTKYIKKKKQVGLQFDFPRAPWSAEYFESLTELLNQRKFEYELQQVNPSPQHKLEDQVSEFIVVDLKQDLDAAVELTRLVLLEIFKLSPVDTVTLWYRHISLYDEKIGF